MSITKESLKDKIRNQKSGYGGTELRNAFLKVSNEPLENAVTLPIERVVVNPMQPRQVFNVERDNELAEDISKRGVLQPILVRPYGESETGAAIYQVIAGERRRRATEKAGLLEIPVIICYVDEQEARFISLVENLQRAELDPLDEQAYYESLQAGFNLGIKDIASLIHKSETYVRNRINGRVTTQLDDINLIEREGLDSEKDNKSTSKEVVLQTSQSSNQNRVKPHYNPAAFRRFSVTLDAAAFAIDSGADDKVKTSIRENLEELEKKIAELKARLS